MASGKEQVPPSDWVQRLARYHVPNADPIIALARHATDDAMDLRTLDTNGDLHFPPPAAWRETHPFSVPQGFRHSGGHRDRLFSDEVRGGRALSMWLRADALSKSIPYDAAIEQLEKRATTLCNALKNKLNIEPLEVRVFIPKEKVREATRERGHEVCACLILATDHEHRDMLNKLVYPEMRKGLLEGRRLDQLDADRARKELSPHTFEKMLDEHRDPKTQQLGLSKPQFPLHELADGLKSDPYMLTIKADGHYEFELPPVNGVSHTYCITPENLSHAGSKHILILPMRSDFSDMPKLNLDYGLHDPHQKPGTSAAFEHDRASVMPAVHTLAAALGGDWTATNHYQTAMGDVTILSVDAPNAQELLTQAQEALKHARLYRQNKRADWRDMLEVRGIDPQPPSR